MIKNIKKEKFSIIYLKKRNIFSYNSQCQIYNMYLLIIRFNY